MTDYPPSAYQPLYDQSGTANNIDPLFLRAQAITESGENPTAVSPAGASGVSGFMPETAKTAGPNGAAIDPLRPEQAIPAQGRLMDTLLTKYTDPNGNVDTATALREYQGGPDRSIWGANNAAYPGKVMAVYAALKQAQQPPAPATPAPVANLARVKQMQADDAATQVDSAANLARVKQMQADDAATPAAPVAPPAAPPSPEKHYFSDFSDHGGNEYGITDDPRQFDKPGLSIPSQTILSPMAQDALDARQRQGGVGGFLAGLGSTAATDIGTGLGVVGLGGNALYRGAQDIVAKTGEAVGAPQLGRDLAAMPDAFMGSPHSFGALDVAGARRLALEPNPLDLAVARARSRVTEMTPAERSAFGNSQRDPVPAPAPPTAAGPTPSPVPQPQAGGADVTRITPPDLTPGQEAAYNKSRLNQTASDRASTQTEVYVPGTTQTPAMTDPYGIANPTAPKTEQITNAMAEKQARAGLQGAEARTKLDKIDQENNNVLKDYHADTAGDPIAIETAETARDELKPDFTNQKPVDAQGVVDHIDQVLKSPAGKQDAVRNALNKVRDSLYDADGNLETMPDQLYGARKNLTNMMSKIGQQADPSLRHATSELMGVKEALDPVINDGNPGFTDYLKNWNEASKPIDAMKQLQSYNLTDVNGNMQLSRVNKMMTDIVNKKAADGANAAKSITPEQMDRLWNMRDELARNSQRDAAVAVKGSDTAQMLNASAATPSALGSAVRAAAGFTGDLAVHKLLAATTGGLGNPLYVVGKSVVNAARASAAANKAAAARNALAAHVVTPQNPLSP